MPIHTTLRKARETAGLSLEKAAEAIGISGASFSRMETGLSKVTTERLEELAKLYQVSASALLEGSIVSNPTNVDLQRMRQVVEVVQAEVNRLKVRPSPEKMGLAVSEVYRIEIEHIVQDPKTEFDPARHRTIIEAIVKK
ncbi:helix-turn-helix domain-containing protein [Roseibium sp.]|uniref:helix-turn-helix domain-containing protein n=1 Tax=Roseibium sp. TaxID=1936156 RepID=UPI00391D97C2